ncbi:bifunctional UDP-N-acetylglucosamine diphosphorylase/glucosamine-1-phosphate N-acetyltransferase GlmU [Petroclostridium sp. X23]|uniref:bifunctional UDP-N-acetylglucosamine diphosphorylase/glucosamine-1-phosphate N-acetyltransferase GlmU n=1 Tax=Petroclostridium sp. X23 TaxID=3045146 RepID=UPI0024ADD55C|nr:bifunctional UDP-N-acetylglucosamine diphosphorylase/glucosamine-1-phosphate N-acetyltransferase GlmU [Petroclostridium sp. X23]WHH57603.1 bifunctional UDP-N-acetylglucosamine diphosphorylase/glucosamine-1-phosphate N-acetyltransferase GlmU [Petroclostridium sp. X23]
MKDLSAIILAAGEGKRMNSKTSKVLHKICGKPLIEWVYDSIQEAGIQDCIMVVGHKADQVKSYMGQKVKFALQEKQLGTGHAVMQAQPMLTGMQGHVIILCGDTPLIKGETIKSALDYHIENDHSATILTTEVDNPTGYGRIIRDVQGNVLKIVEQKDTNQDEQEIKEINSGIYCFKTAHLLNALAKLNNDNSQGEYYLTDTIEIILQNNSKVGAVKIGDPEELQGINNRFQLSEAERVMQQRILHKHMENGVTIISPLNTYIGADVDIGMDTIVYPGCILEGSTKIGENCVVGPNSRIVNSVIENDAEIQNSVVIDSSVGENTHVGPFAYIRPESTIGKNVKIGDFVEVKKSVIGDYTKVSHLTYIGDADVGQNVNMGCGSVIVNYDGQKKHRTTIGDNAFIGCNANLVSPVTVKNNAYVAAGSTITEDVPESSLAIARERQVVKEGWMEKKGRQHK